MKRHPSLEPFSRDHNDGLILARRLSMAGGDTSRVRAEALEAWRLELQDHFDEEERLLAPLMTGSQAERMQAEHRAIAADISLIERGEAGEADLHRLGAALDVHIRWEERELFPAIEQRATEEQLAALAVQTDVMEERHGANGLSPRRAELVARRKAQS